MTDAQQFLGPLTLLHGKHDRGQGMCAMEAAAYLAGEKHSDHPECVSPVIAEFMRAWNDALSDADRQMLKPWIPKVLHTRTSAADEETRAWLALDWLVRVQTPMWLDLAGLGRPTCLDRLLPAGPRLQHPNEKRGTMRGMRRYRHFRGTRHDGTMLHQMRPTVDRARHGLLIRASRSGSLRSTRANLSSLWRQRFGGSLRQGKSPA